MLRKVPFSTIGTWSLQRWKHRFIAFVNQPTILQEIDKALGVKKPPAVEYIYVNPAKKRFGHSAIRYTLPSGEQKVMNIVGQPGAELVNFLTPDDYLFGQPGQVKGAEQGGVHERSFFTVRLEHVAPEKVQAMHEYYLGLQSRNLGDSSAAYSFALGPLYALLRRFLPNFAEKGNCAQWTSKGLVVAGLLEKPSMWPKLLYLRLLIRHTWENVENVNLVAFESAQPMQTHETGLVSLWPWHRWYRPFHSLDYLVNMVVRPKGPELHLKGRLDSWKSLARSVLRFEENSTAGFNRASERMYAALREMQDLVRSKEERREEQRRAEERREEEGRKAEAEKDKPT